MQRLSLELGQLASVAVLFAGHAWIEHSLVTNAVLDRILQRKTALA